MKITDVRIDRQDGYLEFVHENHFIYDLPLKDFKKGSGMNRWLAHLREKDWFTGEVERKMFTAMAPYLFEE